MKLLETVLEQMARVTKTQRQFLRILLSTLMLLRGKANFRNLSRYRRYEEKTYSRGFRCAFELVEFNRLSLKPVTHSGNTLRAALDCRFIPNSGKHTYGLGKFYHSTHQKAAKGLEISTLALVDVTPKTAYNLSTRQTPKLEQTDETRVDWHHRHLQTDRHALPAEVRYRVTDGYYRNTKFINGVVALGLHQVGKLRHDADRRWLYQGPQNARGRPKRYDGKVNFDDLSRVKLVGQVEGVFIYTAIVNRARFQRDLRIVYLVKPTANHPQTALLCSTDTELWAVDLYRFYKTRFQIEFWFRDAKQFTGLSDCQARHPQSLHFHFNASMTALNLIKLEERQQAPNERRVISIASWKIRKAKAHLLERFSTALGLDFSSIKSSPVFAELCNYGAITT